MPSIVGPTRVEDSAEQGRVLVASKAFEIGEHVLVETPLISWPSGENYTTKFLDALCDADEPTRAAVVEMFHPALTTDDDSVRELRTEAATWLAAGERPSYMTLDYVHSALLVKKLNAHSFQAATRIALFEVGSKASHSCYPNCAYSSRDVPGHLVVKAIRPISPGDQITISYIGDVFLKSTADRREELLETKLFNCMCSRCIAPDPLRAMPCVVDDSHTMFVESSPSPSDEGVFGERWVCTREDCRASPEDKKSLDMLILEESAVAAKLQHEAGTAFVEESTEDPTSVMELIGLVPRTNAITIRGHLLLAQILTSRAEDAEKENVSRGKHLRFKAAQEIMNACRIIEFIAAGCVEKCSNNEHPTVYQCSPHILAAAKDLHLAGMDANQNEIAIIAKYIIRYRKCMTTMWPVMAEDADMMAKFEDFKTWATTIQ